MTQTAVQVPARAGQEVQITIAATPISTRERNIAFGVIVVIAVLGAIVAPFAHVQLARVDAFIPAVQSVMCVIDLLTAVLLLAQYSIQPTRRSGGGKRVCIQRAIRLYTDAYLSRSIFSNRFHRRYK